MCVTNIGILEAQIWNKSKRKQKKAYILWLLVSPNGSMVALWLSSGGVVLIHGAMSRKGR